MRPQKIENTLVAAVLFGTAAVFFALGGVVSALDAPNNTVVQKNVSDVLKAQEKAREEGGKGLEEEE